MVHSHTVHLPLGALLIWRTVCGTGARLDTLLRVDALPLSHRPLAARLLVGLLQVHESRQVLWQHQRDGRDGECASARPSPTGVVSIGLAWTTWYIAHKRHRWASTSLATRGGMSRRRSHTRRYSSSRSRQDSRAPRRARWTPSARSMVCIIRRRAAGSMAGRRRAMRPTKLRRRTRFAGSARLPAGSRIVTRHKNKPRTRPPGPSAPHRAYTRGMAECDAPACSHALLLNGCMHRCI